MTKHRRVRQLHTVSYQPRPGRGRPPAQARSAVNDTSRELGGMLGVAITGSVFISPYSPWITDPFAGTPGLVNDS